MIYRKYQIKSGRYVGMWHVREYLGNQRYFHVGRYRTEDEAESAIKHLQYNNA